MSLVDAWAENSLRTATQLTGTHQTGAPSQRTPQALGTDPQFGDPGSAAIFSLQTFDVQMTRYATLRDTRSIIPAVKIVVCPFLRFNVLNC
jgi:hypothetical protein